MSSQAAPTTTVWDLPPLILHPFNEKVPPGELLENSRAALMLSGLIPGDGSDPAELRRKVLWGRYTEIRMLFFLGKDLFRWIEQCLECLQRIPQLSAEPIHAQSFAGLLTGRPPEPVVEKLKAWGVFDYAAIFSRAIGLNAIYQQPPEFASLSEHFLRHYHAYADHLFECFLEAQEHQGIAPENFRFSLYASGEYSQMLETEWGAE